MITSKTTDLLGRCAEVLEFGVPGQRLNRSVWCTSVPRHSRDFVHVIGKASPELETSFSKHVIVAFTF